MFERNEQSYGKLNDLGILDKYGFYLSQTAINKEIKRYRAYLKKEEKEVQVLDIGCGYNADHLIQSLKIIADSTGTGIDLSVNQSLNNERVCLIEGDITNKLSDLSDNCFDIIIMNSVLEHIEYEQVHYILNRIFNLLKNKGLFLINVPTWRGKFFLEFSAFTLKTNQTSRIEINDHKMYYEKNSMWPLLVQAGFFPEHIKLKYHKYGLNLFGVVYKT